MERINSNEALEEARRYGRWILFYDYPWAPSGLNKGAFLFWVHRKQIYLSRGVIPLPIYDATEGDCSELDQWIISHMKKTGGNLVGSGWGSVILCKKDQFVTAVPMLIESGITHLNQLVEAVYSSEA